MLVAWTMVFLGYWFGWYGYATLQQPSQRESKGNTVGITDLILPTRINKVDAAIQANWFKSAGSQAGTGGQSSGSPNPCPDGTLDSTGHCQFNNPPPGDPFHKIQA